MPVHVYRNGDVVSFPNAKAIIRNKTGKTSAKTYKMTYQIYRTLSGAVVNMYRQRENNITFLTLTSRDSIDHRTFNRLLSKFLENMKENYNLRSYIWVAEKQKRGAIHYHILMDCEYYDIKKLRKYYNKLIEPYSRTSKNNLRLPPRGGIVADCSQLVKYMCKYMSKSINCIYNARCYGVTHNLLSKPIKFRSLKHISRIVQEQLIKQNDYNYVRVYNCDYKLYDYADEIYKAIQPLPERKEPEIIQMTINFNTDKHQENISKTSDKHQENISKTSDKNSIKNLKIQDIRNILKKQKAINRDTAFYAFENDKSFNAEQVRRERIEFERRHYNDYAEN